MSIDSKILHYDPKSYWDTREHPNTAAAPGISEHDRSFLLPRITGVGSLLEIGPGVGRLFPLYKGVSQISTLDLSRNYQERALRVARLNNISINDFYIDDPLAVFPFEDQRFEIGIASHVLMHIPFDIIEHTMREAARVCQSVLVVSAIHQYWPRVGQSFDPKWHCFAHDYETLCRKIGCNYYDYTQFSQGEIQGSFGFRFSKY